jgi:hypothetical protein
MWMTQARNSVRLKIISSQAKAAEVPRSVLARTTPSAKYSHSTRLSQRYVGMRHFDSPESANANGKTLIAKVPRPVGASHSSHIKPSAISPTVIAMALARLQATAEGKGAAACIAGYHASNADADPIDTGDEG